VGLKPREHRVRRQQRDALGGAAVHLHEVARPEVRDARGEERERSDVGAEQPSKGGLALIIILGFSPFEDLPRTSATPIP
jgi:hypothetical protein